MNELDQAYLEQIAQFIRDNSNGSKVKVEVEESDVKIKQEEETNRDAANGGPSGTPKRNRIRQRRTQLVRDDATRRSKAKSGQPLEC